MRKSNHMCSCISHDLWQREVRCSFASSEIGAASFASAKFLLSNKKIRIYIVLVGCWYYDESGWIELLRCRIVTGIKWHEDSGNTKRVLYWMHARHGNPLNISTYLKLLRRCSALPSCYQNIQENPIP
jgi:hypothetical protein